MLKFLVVATIISMPFIAYVPAQFWTFCGDPWCLSVYPEWLDRFIYSMVAPYLSPDISVAASQMEFIEVWITTVIILEAFSLLMIFLFRKKFSDDH